MSRRSNRASYPDYVKYMTRFDAGDIQRATGIPASLIHKARRGDVETFSNKTLQKFESLYTRYWESRLDKAGITPDNWKPLIKSHEVTELRDIVRGVENRNKLDRKLERGGVNPDQREKIIETYSPGEVRELIDKNREVAERIVENRRKRDRNNPDLKHYKDSWHTVSQVLEQMARDTSRIASDWAWIAQYGSPKRKKAWIPGPNQRGQYQH